MKLRHKQSGVVLEGQFCKLDNSYGRSWYQHHGVHSTSEYCASEWEEVKPEPKWVDVTAECEWVKHECGDFMAKWKNDWYIKHGGRRVEGWPEKYRLRKIEVLSESYDYAFIIEQRQP